jgi:hypothetical protein
MGNEPTQGASAAPRRRFLKTAGLPSSAVHAGPLQFSPAPSDSTIVRHRLPVSAELAVVLAVIE